jgi:hypothetical protein
MSKSDDVTFESSPTRASIDIADSAFVEFAFTGVAGACEITIGMEVDCGAQTYSAKLPAAVREALYQWLIGFSTEKGEP